MKAACSNLFDEGGNVTIFDERLGNIYRHADGDFADEPMIYRAFQPLPRFGDGYTLIGGWIIDDEASGMSSRGQYAFSTKTLPFRPTYCRLIILCDLAPASMAQS